MIRWRTMAIALCLAFAHVAPVAAGAAAVDSTCKVTSNLDGAPGNPQYEIPAITTVVSEFGPAGTRIYGDESSFYGERGLWVGLPDDGILGPPYNGDAHDNGSVDWVKIWMYRDDEARGTIQMTGTLLSEPFHVATPHVPEGYGFTGFQVGSMTFPTVGCWKITVTSGQATMNFTIWVQREPVPSATPVASGSRP